MSVILTTTPNVDGYKITKYLGLVSSNAYYNYNGYGHYSAGDEWKVITDNLRSSAERMGADAVVGIQITTAGAGDLYHMIAQGTAVKLEEAGFDDELPDL